MVTAGVYMVVRCNSIFQNAPTAMFIVAIIGCATAIFAATIGLAQNDIKKVLAYSTVSQLGYMFLACGVGAFIAAIFHVMTHAFFKALLFLGSGSVIHGMHHEQDMRRMGNLRKYLPITFFTMLMGWLAICGIPIWAGFFSKDEILYRTFAAPNLPGNWNYVLWGVGLLTAVLTAVYMTRLMVMTFFGEERFQLALHDDSDAHDPAHAEENAFATGAAQDDEMHHGVVVDAEHDEDDEHHALPADFHPHESPITMTIPLIVLAILATLGGLVGIPFAVSSMFGAGDVNVFERTLEPVIYHRAANAEHSVPALEAPGGHAAASGTENNVPAEHAAAAEHSASELSEERTLAGLSVLLALLGIGIGWFVFNPQPLRKLPRILVDKWRVDELYNGYIVDPITTLSREGFWKGFDLGFIDGVVNGAGYFTMAMGSVLRRIQVGFIRSYAAIILLGALVVLGYFIYFGYRLIG
jgi:NADH-quinone oxidoreductase subunit L